jgi:hypothetical protein
MGFRGMIRPLVGASTAALAAAALLFGPGSATAATGQEEIGVAATRFHIKHASQRTNLDSNRSGAVYTLRDSGSSYQKWDNYATGKFRNVATGLCLGSDGTNVFTTSCALSTTDWTTTSGSPKYFIHRNTGRYLHNDGISGQHLGMKPTSTGATRWSVLATS